MLTKSYIYFTAVLLSTVIFALAGCGGTSTSQNGQGAISAKLVWNSNKTTGKIVASAPTGVSTVRLAISGTGITTIQHDFPAADRNGTLSSVPVGSGLTVTASGLDSSGTIIYQGAKGNVSVQNGTTTDVGTIIMTSTAPAQVVFTTSMISGKTFKYSDLLEPDGMVTFNVDGTYTKTDGNPGAWSVNQSGQLVLNKASGGVHTMTLTASTATVITVSDYFVHSDSTFETFTMTLTAMAQTSTSIIGTWGGYGEPKISFLDSTHYLIVSAENAVPEQGVYTGLEYGTYTWDSVTGIGTFATQIIDTNGDGGASNPPAGTSYKITFSGDILTIDNEVEGSMQLSRLKSSVTNPVVGSWGGPFADAATGAVLITFVDDTHCILAQADTSVDPSGQSGIELGTYTIDATNVLHTTLVVDTNGDWGFQSKNNTNHVYTISVSGDILTIAEPTASLPEDRAPRDISRLQ